MNTTTIKFDAFENLKLDSVCISSLFHYNLIHSKVPLNKLIMGNKSFLLSNQTKSDLEDVSVKYLKDKLRSQKVKVR